MYFTKGKGYKAKAGRELGRKREAWEVGKLPIIRMRIHWISLHEVLNWPNFLLDSHGALHLTNIIFFIAGIFNVNHNTVKMFWISNGLESHRSISFGNKEAKIFFNNISLLVDKMVLHFISEMRHYVYKQTGKFEISYSRILVIFARIRLFVFEALQGILDLNLLKRNWNHDYIVLFKSQVDLHTVYERSRLLSSQEYAFSGIIQLPLLGIRLLLSRDLIGQPKWTNYSFLLASFQIINNKNWISACKWGGIFVTCDTYSLRLTSSNTSLF